MNKSSSEEPKSARQRSGNIDGPDAGGAFTDERIGCGRPNIELTGDCDAGGVGGPYAEGSPGLTAAVVGSGTPTRAQGLSADVNAEQDQSRCESEERMQLEFSHGSFVDLEITTRGK